MGSGIFLVIVGAILAFAVRTDSSVVDVQVVGLILMIAGGAVIYHARRGTTREREVKTVEDVSDPERPVRTVHEEVTEQDPSGPMHPRT